MEAAQPLSLVPLGDSAVLLVLGDGIDLATSARVHAVAAAVGAAALPWVLDVVPSYAAVAVHYEPLHTGHDDAAAALRAIATGALTGATVAPAAREHVIPVRYDGPDLAEVARLTSLTVGEVVARHCAPLYTVYMLGFVPGFAYLGELDPALALARLARPRARVPAGSVAIAGRQTAIYPLATPGGWHILGSTDVRPFDPSASPPTIFRAGDRVRFEPVP
ncbi:MAG: 5-oxoprolinase subunit PxpB [Gemmatimonadaceae bacterium]